MLTHAEYLRLLASHEVALADLYRLYADAVPEYRDFWLRLAGEEKAHAAVLGELHDRLGHKAMTFREPVCGEGEINGSLEFIERSTNQCLAKGATMHEALQVARFLELGVLEQRFFEALDQDSPEWKSRLGELARHTREHLDRVTGLAAKLGLDLR